MSSPFIVHLAEALSSRRCALRSASPTPSAAGSATSTPTRCSAPCYTALLDAAGMAPEHVEDLVVGCTAPFGEQSRNIARNAWLQAGYPPEVPATALGPALRLRTDRGGDGCRAGASGTPRPRDCRRRGAYGPRSDELPRQDLRTLRRSVAAELRDRYDFVPQGESAELIADRWQLQPGGDGRVRGPLPPPGRRGNRGRPVRRAR